MDILQMDGLLGRVEKEVDTKYSNAVGVPQYLPSSHCPEIYELYNDEKYKTVIRHINQANIAPEVKEFLKIGATRHIVFNYAKIADFYARQPEEIQKLMEESALVIIDLDDAIANSYVKMSSKIRDIIAESGVFAKDGKNDNK